MPTNPSVIDLSALDGTNGFRIRGAQAEDYRGISVAGAGDVNSDGFDDLIIGNPHLHASYVVFSNGRGFISSFNLSALDGSNGFKISGEAANDYSGYSVAGAGDVNGDGFDDLIIGAPGDKYAYGPGASYIVFGKQSGFASEIELSALDGANGFQISGEAAGDKIGFSVASAGDVNGDGFDDLIMGTPLAGPNGSDSGASYVVFGQASGFASDIDLSALDGGNGFKISGEARGDESGGSVASAGDVNGDGYDDLIIGAVLADPNGNSSGASYVVFGRPSGFASTLELSALDGSNGFKISGEAAGDHIGFSVASAGDVNGDGFADLIIGAPGASSSYIVFGKQSGFVSDIELSALDGANGFQINGEATSSPIGWSVAGAGDVNGDGFDDLIIGALHSDPYGSASGASYVVFGQASGFASRLDLSALDGANGFQIYGFRGSHVSGAGDVNGDGFADLILGPVGAPASYVVYGRAMVPLDRSGTESNDFLVGGPYDDTLSGDGGDDTLAGRAGADNLDGGTGSDTADYSASADAVTVDLATGTVSGGDAAGDTLTSIENVLGSENDDSLTGDGGANQLDGSNGNDALSGNDGNDTLLGQGGADNLDGGAGADELLGGSGNDTLAGGLSADDLDGGTGTDTADYSASPDGVKVNLATSLGSGGHAADDTLTSIENLIGSTGDDTLAGNHGANLLSGLAGDDLLYGGTGEDVLFGGTGADTIHGGGGSDTLTGGPGADSLDGGNGKDTAVYKASANAVAVDLRTGVAAGGDATGDTLASIENVVGSAGNDTLDGSASGNSLIGNGGNDHLLGRFGQDSLFGGSGHDTLIGGPGADDLHGGAGRDVAGYSSSSGPVSVDLLTGVGSGGDAKGDSLGGIENVIGSSGNDSLRGNPGANRLMGGDGKDTLIGGSGNDRLFGGGGNDSLNGGDGNDHLKGGGGNDNAQGGGGDDTLFGYAGNDRLVGGTGSDSIVGGAGDDTLIGNNGNDTLVGSAGFDLLKGGGGNDVFVFNQKFETKLGALRDRIADFTQGDDRIDLSGIDADTTHPGNDAFHFIGSDPFSGTAGELHQFFSGAKTIIEGDVTGNGQADFQIALLASHVTLTDTDFML